MIFECGDRILILEENIKLVGYTYC